VSSVDASRRAFLRRLGSFGLAAAFAACGVASAEASAATADEAALRDEADPGAAPFEVGAERCPYCSMAVIDARFAAQQRTVSGRVHVYDAIECLVDHIAGHGGPPLTAGWCYIADYAASSRDAAQLISVHEATVVQHERFRTPMGGGLVGFGSAAGAAAFVAERGVGNAEAWAWSALVERARTEPWVRAR